MHYKIAHAKLAEYKLGLFTVGGGLLPALRAVKLAFRYNGEPKLRILKAAGYAF